MQHDPHYDNPSNPDFKEDKTVPRSLFFYPSNIHVFSDYISSMGVMPSIKPMISLNELNLFLGTIANNPIARKFLPPNPGSLRMQKSFIEAGVEKYILFSEPAPGGLCVGYSLTPFFEPEPYNSHSFKRALSLQKEYETTMTTQYSPDARLSPGVHITKIASMDKEGTCDGSYKYIDPQEFGSTAEEMTNSFTEEANLYIRKSGIYTPKNSISGETYDQVTSHVVRLSVDGKGNCSFFDANNGLAISKCEQRFLNAVMKQLNNEPPELPKGGPISVAKVKKVKIESTPSFKTCNFMHSWKQNRKTEEAELSKCHLTPKFGG